jgi:hypothetical protein
MAVNYCFVFSGRRNPDWFNNLDLEIFRRKYLKDYLK